MSSAGLDRMEGIATALGRAWAKEVHDALLADGRRPTGAWPGTVSEARTCALRLMGQDFQRESAESQERLVRALYSAARRNWRTWHKTA